VLHDARQGAHVIALREHAQAIVGKYPELLEHRTLHHEFLIEEIWMQGVGGQQVSGMDGAGEIALTRFPVVAPVARRVLHVFGQEPVVHQ